MRTEIQTNKQKQNKNFFIERYFRYWQWSFQMIQKIKEYAKYLWKAFLNSKQMVGMGCVCLTAATLWSNKGIETTVWSTGGFGWQRSLCTQCGTTLWEGKYTNPLKKRNTNKQCRGRSMTQSSPGAAELCSSSFANLLQWQLCWD